MQGFRRNGKSFHTSFAILKNRIVCVGWNCYNSPHNQYRFGVYKKEHLPGKYTPCRHSECHLHEKLDKLSWKDYEILNIRMNQNGEPRLAMPCENCLDKVIVPMRPKRMYFTDNDNSYQNLILE